MEWDAYVDTVSLLLLLTRVQAPCPEGCVQEGASSGCRDPGWAPAYEVLFEKTGLSACYKRPNAGAQGVAAFCTVNLWGAPPAAFPLFWSFHL